MVATPQAHTGYGGMCISRSAGCEPIDVACCSEFSMGSHRALGRPAQSIMYVPLQVNRFQNFILRIVQYKYLKSCSRRLYCPNLILRTRLCGTMFIPQPSCVVDFHLTEICQAEMICIGGVPVLKRHFGGAGPQIFYMIHRGGRISCILRSCLCVT